LIEPQLLVVPTRRRDTLPRRSGPN
jgi:hypothetical protein